MKMKAMQSTFAMFAAVTMMGATSTALAQGKGKGAAVANLEVDSSKSSVRWLGKKVTGEHSGTIALKSGQVELDGKNVKGGIFEIDMGSIVVEDLKDPEWNKKLNDHLKSDDFFGVANHPISTFKITSVKPVKKKDTTHEITGDLTIKGITHAVTFPAKIEVKGNEASAKGKVTVDRTKYNIRYGSGKFFDNLGDKMINDDFQLELDLKSKQ
jgi:polyisoprenoid-binding protein YceI